VPLTRVLTASMQSPKKSGAGHQGPGAVRRWQARPERRAGRGRSVGRRWLRNRYGSAAGRTDPAAGSQPACPRVRRDLVMMRLKAVQLARSCYEVSGEGCPAGIGGLLGVVGPSRGEPSVANEVGDGLAWAA